MVNFYLDEGELPSIIQPARLKGNFKVLPKANPPVKVNSLIRSVAYKDKLYTFMKGMYVTDPFTGVSQDVSGNAPATILDRQRVTLLAAPEKGIIYLFGGRSYSNSNNYLFDLWQYVVDTKTWTKLSTATFNKAEGAMGLYNNKLFVTGGYGAIKAEVMNIYDLATNMWSVGKAGPTGRIANNPGFAQKGSKLYLFGGSITPNILASVDVYDMATDTWTQLADMPTPLIEAACGVVGEYIYLFGGNAGSAQNGKLQEYSIKTNKWSLVTTDSMVRQSPIHGVIADKLYVISGEPMATTIDRSLEIS